MKAPFLIRPYGTPRLKRSCRGRRMLRRWAPAEIPTVEDFDNRNSESSNVMGSRPLESGLYGNGPPRKSRESETGKSPARLHRLLRTRPVPIVIFSSTKCTFSFGLCTRTGIKIRWTVGNCETGILGRSKLIIGRFSELYHRFWTNWCKNEDLLIHGDSMYDMIDKQDHQGIQSELLRSANTPGDDTRMFLCRMNVSRNARRQMRFGDQKKTLKGTLAVTVVLVQGHYLSFLPLCSRNEPVFLATCTPVAMPETRECVVQGATNVFTTIHSMDMKFVHVDR
ncbi:unnamed protein product, partial [Nesidiocoris tenuis]